jgi:hypothetical protein
MMKWDNINTLTQQLIDNAHPFRADYQVHESPLSDKGYRGTRVTLFDENEAVGHIDLSHISQEHLGEHHSFSQFMKTYYRHITHTKEKAKTLPMIFKDLFQQEKADLKGVFQPMLSELFFDDQHLSYDKGVMLASTTLKEETLHLLCQNAFEQLYGEWLQKESNSITVDYIFVDEDRRGNNIGVLLYQHAGILAARNQLSIRQSYAELDGGVRLWEKMAEDPRIPTKEVNGELHLDYHNNLSKLNKNAPVKAKKIKTKL